MFLWAVESVQIASACLAGDLGPAPKLAWGFKALRRESLPGTSVLFPPPHCESLSKQPLAQPALGCMSSAVFVQSTEGCLEPLDDTDPAGERRRPGLRGEDDADELMLRLMASSGDQEGQQGPWAGTEIRGSRDQPRAHQPAPEALCPLPGSPSSTNRKGSHGLLGWTRGTTYTFC